MCVGESLKVLDTREDRSGRHGVLCGARSGLSFFYHFLLCHGADFVIGSVAWHPSEIKKNVVTGTARIAVPVAVKP